MTKEKMNICILSSDAFVPHAAALIASIMENKDVSDDIVIHYFCENVTGESKEYLLSMKRKWNFCIRLYDLTADFFEGYKQYGYRHSQYNRSYMGYYKIVIPRLLPQEIDKALILDSDMIAHTSLSSLYETNLEGRYAAVVAETEMKNRVITTHNGPYFNAGTILVNLKKYREDQVEEQIKEIIQKKGINSFPFLEQDLFNEIFRGEVVCLPLKWNMMFTNGWRKAIYKHGFVLYPFPEEEIHEAENNPGIIHYLTAEKPWFPGSKHPGRNTYWKYLKQTPFFGQVRNEYYRSVFKKLFKKPLKESIKESIKVSERLLRRWIFKPLKALIRCRPK